MSSSPEATLPKRQMNLSADLGSSDSTISYYWIGPVVAALEFLGLILLSVVSAAAYAWLTTDTFAFRPTYAGLGCLVAGLTVSLLEARGLYRRSFVLSKDSARLIFNVWLTVFSFLAVSAFLLDVGWEFSRGALLIYFVSGGGALIGGRLLGRCLLGRAIASGRLRGRRVYVIGERDQVSTDDLAMSLRRHGYTVVASFLFDALKDDSRPPRRGSWDDIVAMIKAKEVDEVMLAVGWSNHAGIQSITNALATLPVSVRLLPDRMIAKLIDRPMIDIGLTKTVELKREPLCLHERILKRAFDVVVSGTALLVLSPMLLAIAALIKRDSPGPVLFRQTRVGFNGKTFRIFKFRTMKTLDDGPEIRQATRFDDRVTQIGRWLRATSVDELPQLVNVFAGDMSLVGPRPHAVAHNNKYDLSIANYAVRHRVKPGITGWAQVCGFRGETPTVDLMLKRVEHDLWYIDNWSFWLDSKIVARTAIALMRPQNAY
jgi:Undecaprenyl-phosphate glucose phosphotransferase